MDNFGGVKFGLKKMWVQKWVHTKTQYASHTPLTYSGVQNGIWSPVNSSVQNGIWSPVNLVSSEVKKEKLNGNNKMPTAVGKSTSGSETDDESESCPVEGKGKNTGKEYKKKMPTNNTSSSSSCPSPSSSSSGKKRGSTCTTTTTGKEKKVKKIKSSHDSLKNHESDFTCTSSKTVNHDVHDKELDNNSEQQEITKKNKSKAKKATALAAAKESLSQDSDLTEEETVDDSSCHHQQKEAVVSTAKKRGRKPKNVSGEKSSPTNSHSEKKKKSKKKQEDKDEEEEDTAGQVVKKGKKGKNKPSYLETVDKSGKPFLQDKSCSEVVPSVKSCKDVSSNASLIPKCRECRMTPSQKIKDVGPSIFCRFYQFRKLVFDKDLKAAGFSEPKDAKEEDFRLWLPPDPNLPIPSGQAELLKQVDALFLIDFVGDHFCNLVAQEARALAIH